MNDQHTNSKYYHCDQMEIFIKHILYYTVANVAEKQIICFFMSCFYDTIKYILSQLKVNFFSSFFEQTVDLCS